MQTHLTCHLQQQNTQDIIHQTKFHLDELRSHIPENKCSKSQQQRWAEQGDQKSRASTARNSGLNNGGVFSRERKWSGRWMSEWRARWGPPHRVARPPCWPRQHMGCSPGVPHWSAPGTPRLQFKK